METARHENKQGVITSRHQNKQLQNINTAEIKTHRDVKTALKLSEEI
jgi:hypothetical protein